MGKKAKIFFIVFCAIIFASSKTSAQNKLIDSLLVVLKNAREDTNKVKVLNELGWEYIGYNHDSSYFLLNKALTLATKMKWKKGKAEALAFIGGYHFDEGNYPKALEFYNKALKIDEAIKNKSGIARRLGNIGVVFKAQAEYSKALEYYFKALKIFEELEDKNRIAIWLGCIGNIYFEQAEYSKALEYYFKALKIEELLRDKNGIAITLSNIGAVFLSQANHPKFSSVAHDSLFNKALEYYLKALKTFGEFKDKIRMSGVFGNIGVVYYKQANYSLALNYYLKALNIVEELGRKSSIAIWLGNIGSLYTNTGNFVEAEKYLQRSLALSDSIGDLEGVKETNQYLSSLYDTTGRYKLALEHYKKYIAARDSITNEENTKKQVQQEMQYTFDKQQAADSIKTAEHSKQEKLKHDQEIKQQKIYTYGGIIGFSLMLIVAFVSFRAFRNKQKANLIIEQQKMLVEEKQKEVLDSIHYAKRIQLALLPSEKNIDKQLRKLNG